MAERHILVTGSSGLLGHAVAHLASRRYSCFGFDASTPSEAVSGVHHVNGDLRDAFRLVQIMRDYRINDVIHAGAISHPLLLAEQPSVIHAINVDGTLNVLEAARLCSVERVVFVSSAAVYGSPDSEVVIDENSPLKPDNIYGATKAAAEMLVGGYARRYGLAPVILRPVSIYGPRRRTFALPNYLIARAIDGVPSRVLQGDATIDFISVEDVARASLLALETASAVGRVYVVATGEPRTYRSIAELVCALVPGSRIDVEPGSTGTECRYSSALAEQDLGFRATIGLEQGLAQLKDALAARPDLREIAGTASELSRSIAG
jgi:UDP-glucose 4-epimerase